MADLRSLRRSRSLRGERPEAKLGESSFSLTPLRHFCPLSFDREAKDFKQPTKCHRVELLSVEEESDSFGDDWVDYLPSGFPFTIYQTHLSSPSPKR